MFAAGLQSGLTVEEILLPSQRQGIAKHRRFCGLWLIDVFHHNHHEPSNGGHELNDSSGSEVPPLPLSGSSAALPHTVVSQPLAGGPLANLCFHWNEKHIFRHGQTNGQDVTSKSTFEMQYIYSHCWLIKLTPALILFFVVNPRVLSCDRNQNNGLPKIKCLGIHETLKASWYFQVHFIANIHVDAQYRMSPLPTSKMCFCKVDVSSCRLACSWCWCKKCCARTANLQGFHQFHLLSLAFGPILIASTAFFLIPWMDKVRY